MKSRLLIACWKAVAVVGLIVTVGCSGFTSGQGGVPSVTLQEVTPPGQGGVTPRGHGGILVPRPDHVVIVIEENHAYSEIIGSSSAPYINSLASQGPY